MSDTSAERLPDGQDDLTNAEFRLDPSGMQRRGISRFFSRLEAVRAMDDDEVPDDLSDAWLYKDPSFVAANRKIFEKFEAAAEAVAELIRAEREMFELSDKIRYETGQLLIARNQLASAETIDTSDFELGDSST